MKESRGEARQSAFGGYALSLLAPIYDQGIPCGCDTMEWKETSQAVSFAWHLSDNQAQSALCVTNLEARG